MAAKQITEMVAFLEAMGKTEGQDEQKQAETQARLVQACLADVRASRCFSVSAATDIMTKLAGNPRLPQWIKSQILEVVQEKVEVAAGEQPADTKEKDKRPTQKHNFLFNYLTAEDWQSLQSTTVSMDAKERTLGSRMALLGLLCPKEPCFKQATALLLLAGHTGGLDTFQFNARAAHNLLIDFKGILRTLAKSPVYTHSGLLAYPEAPADLPCHLFKKAYRGKKPEPPLLEVEAVLALAEAVPARKNHGSVVSRPFARAASKRVGDSSLQDLLQNPAALDMVATLFGRGNAGEPALTFCPPKKRKHEPLALPGPASVPQAALALEDNGEACPPLEEPKPSEALEVEAGSGAQGSDAAAEQPQGAENGIDAMQQKILSKLDCKTPAKKSAKEMVEVTPEKVKVKPKAKAKAKVKAKNKAQSEEPKTTVGDLKFPGTAKKPPLRLPNASVYFAESAWRVKKPGERLDKAFSFKLEDPRDVWKRLTKYVGGL